MNRSELPEAASVDPSGTNFGAVRALAERFLGHIFSVDVNVRPTMPDPAALEDFSADLFCAPLAEEELPERLSVLIRGSINPALPGCLRHMDSLPTTMSVLGDLVVVEQGKLRPLREPTGR